MARRPVILDVLSLTHELQMLTTIIVVAIFLYLLILQVILWAIFLRLGLRWAKISDITTRRIVVATASVIAIQLMLYLVFRRAAPSSEVQSLVLGVLELAAAVLVPCLVIMRVFGASLLRSLQAWFPTLLSSVVMILLVVVVLRPFIFEAFVSPTNGMAPTLLGTTWRSSCLECGQANYCSPVDRGFALSDPMRMICSNFHVEEVSDVQQHAFPPDRFLVAKFLVPKRWDVVVFQYPENPSTLYVMRVVGLPGETIHIEGGAVWANGNKLESPGTILGIQYLTEIPEWRRELWGSKGRPAVLGKDEYFVLGDFSAQSMDSRLWEQGAPDHSPFAVPESHLRGVVSHIYWPPQRWRILR